MSYPILTLPIGLSFEYKKTAKFNNIKQTPQSGRHPAVATLQQGTLFDFDLNWNYLKNNGVTTSDDQQYLQEFYEAIGGGFQLFLFDPSQNNLENLSVTQDYTQLKSGFFGVADGASTFPLWRATSALGGGSVTLVERIQNVSAMAGVYINGSLVPSSEYTLTNFPSAVTFTTPPAIGATLAWAGSYNYLCQFGEDTVDFEGFMFQLWELKSLRLESVNL
jgi:hypothetical protein